VDDFDHQLDSFQAQEAAQQAIDKFEKERVKNLEELKDKLEENSGLIKSK
jgi:hypothetical protein